MTQNVYHDNNRDLFVEVSHGPYVVDHNVFASPSSLESFAQGGAYVNNLVCGTVLLQPIPERPTPYHTPHSTQVAGYAAILGGDDRLVGNVFLGGDVDQVYGPGFRFGANASYGTAGYDGHPSSMEEYRVLIGDPTLGDHERFSDVKQPVYIRDNVYATGAEPYEAEQGAVVLDGEVSVRVVAEGDEVYLETAAARGVHGRDVGPRDPRGPAAGAVRRRRLRGRRRQPVRLRHRPRRERQGGGPDLPGRPPRRPAGRLPAHPRLVTRSDVHRGPYGRTTRVPSTHRRPIPTTSRSNDHGPSTHS